MTTLSLRCYAYAKDGTWQAICVDLDIATFAESLDEVKASLATCIEMYLEGIDELPVEDRRRLLTGKTPWPVRAKLATLAWLSRLRLRRVIADHPVGRQQFYIPHSQ